MPRFFIDSDDGELNVRDEEGQDLPDATTARRLATAMLPDMAREKIASGDRHTFLVQVRDEAGTTLYQGMLNFVGAWQDPGAST
ncbi:DUF6894 family protein [Methylobacterium oxalidis]|uniref:DUF6894 domain-containing protein n=1 Tax=Methylobacterium oxalidis TaxID=944322 RepID=A0A512IZK1_9HYPH|nr:hypothetical protein [Methylobacterium oxalidis]GEP03144.1 hypothetical protein MOX02_11820 [Methylobacterium oxalidis]GJE31477.1 hypothetical protein LDDCCGHA_1656 [Methylobacterium oxalidis]GLS67403.1 hypothetical protein GCM10007888_57870 [Methylobacterium oxalidis]